MNAQELLQEISDYCRQTGLAEFDLRPARRQRRQARQPPSPRRPHHHRDARPHPRLHGDQPQRRRAARGDRAGARAAAGTGSPMLLQHRAAAPHNDVAIHHARLPIGSRHRQRRRRSAAQLPLLRQPAEVPAVRQHLLGKMGGGATRLARACQHPSAPAGAAAVRCRRRRRHRAAARDALDARPLPAHAVLRGRQGDQPRGRAARRCRRCRTASPSIRRPCWC